MIPFGGQRFAPVCGSLRRIRLAGEQQRVGPKIHRLILHFSALIADVVRFGEPNDWAERGAACYVILLMCHFHEFCARRRWNAHAPSGR